MLLRDEVPAEEFLQVRLFRKSRALREILFAERKLISLFDLPGILQLEENKAACITDLEYLKSKFAENSLDIYLANQGQQRQNRQAKQSSRTLVYLHQGTLVLQIQILDLARGTQSLIDLALQKIEKTRMSLIEASEPIKRDQGKACASDHLGLITYLASQEGLLRQLSDTNQRLLDVTEALHQLLSIREKHA